VFMYQHIRNRIFVDLGIFFFVLILPWWLNLILVFVGIIHFRYYWEAVFFGICLDLFYSKPDILIFSSAMFVAMLLVLITEFFVKPRLRL